MSTPRLRLSIDPVNPLELDQAWLFLYGVLWVRSLQGMAVASNENAGALDDLEWLGIEPDAMASRSKSERYQEVANRLVDEGRAYICYCTHVEEREMTNLPDADPEHKRYDGRCRRLRSSDHKSLRRSGRKQSIRLIVEPGEVRRPVVDAPDRVFTFESDFKILTGDGEATPAFARLVDEHQARSTHSARMQDSRSTVCQEVLISKALNWPLPQLAILPKWSSSDLATVGELRDLGYLAKALLLALLRANWSPPEGVFDVDDLAEAFSLGDLQREAPPIDDAHLRAINGEYLACIGEDKRVRAVVEHLTRRGYPIAEQEREWQGRFVASVKPQMEILSQAEDLATLILSSSIDYDKEAASVVRDEETQEMIGRFTDAMDAMPSHDGRAWRSLLQLVRKDAAAPGRAISAMRLVLTGQREGPPLASLLSLLGTEGCRSRLEKARRYAAGA